jgi:hypothetical protein
MQRQRRKTIKENSALWRGSRCDDIKVSLFTSYRCAVREAGKVFLETSALSELR